MHDQSNAHQELIEENSFLKHRIKELEQVESELKKMEAALKESERRLTDIIDFLPEATFAIDLSGKIIAWNRAVEEMTGVKAKDMLGKGNYEYSIPFYGIRKPLLIDLVLNNTDFDKKNYDFVKREGNAFLAEAKSIVFWGKAGPLYDSYGNIIGAIESVRDITEFRKAQDDLEDRVQERTAKLMQTNDVLHESEEKLKLCIEATYDGLWDWNVKTDSVYFSPGYYLMLGYEVGDFPTVSKAWQELIHPDDLDRALSINFDCVAGRIEKFEAEFRMKTKGGDWRWILGRGKCVARDEQGYATRVVGTHIDITERKEMEKALQEREEQYRNFFSTSRDCVFITSVDGDWIDLNDAAVQLFGYDSREELLKIKIPNLYANPDDRKWHSQIISEFGYVQNMPLALRKKDGTVIETLRTSTVKKDSTGKVIGYQGTIRDVTEQKRTEKLLRSSEERFRSLVETTSDWIWETNMQGIYTYVSPKIKDILGYEPSEILGKTPVSFMPRAEAARVAKSVLQHFREKKPLTAFESINLHKDARIVILETNGVPVVDENKRLIGYRGVHRDITDRKHAEEALHKSESILRSVFKATPVGLCIMKDRIFQSVNKAFLENMGYSESEIIGHTTRMLYENEKEYRKVGQEFYTGLLELGLTRVQTKLSRKDGSLRDVVLTAVPLKAKDILPGMAVVTVEDITDRRQADVKLKRSENLYRAMFENAGNAHILVHDDTTMILVNSEFEKLSGYSKEEIEGKRSWTDFFVEEDVKQMMKYHSLRRTANDVVPRKYECRLKNKDGNVRDIAISVDMIPSTKESIASLHDITDRKRVETKLRESEERFRIALSNAPITVSTVDNKLRYTWIYNTCHGFIPERVIGKRPDELTPPEDAAQLMALLRHVLETGQSDQREVSGRTKGMPWHYHIIAEPLCDANGVVVGITLAYIDITERIQAEDERRMLEERLNRAEKMEALGMLAGGVAHDLNNVLGSLIGYSELIQDYLPKGHITSEYAINILQSGIRATAIIQDMLTMARRGVAVSEIVNLNDQVYNYLKTPEFENLKMHYPNVQISIKLENNLLNIKGSPIHLSKTIMNLVSNAAESLSIKGKISIKTENRYLDQPIHGYDTMQEGDYAVLIVSDNGSGISAKDIKKIFEPFYTKKVMGRSGTGLGLAVVWGTVKDHNGYIDVQSEEGKGAIFSLYFPVTREEPAKVERKVSYLTNTGKGESILVVDDVLEQRKLATIMLEKLGYQVKAVASGEEAIEYLKNNKADLILLDMIMDPGIDGLETYRRILNINPSQKAIIVSGFSENDRVKEIQELGAGEFIRKPYMIGKIGNAVKKELEKNT